MSESKLKTKKSGASLIHNITAFTFLYVLAGPSSIKQLLGPAHVISLALQHFLHFEM